MVKVVEKGTAPWGKGGEEGGGKRGKMKMKWVGELGSVKFPLEPARILFCSAHRPWGITWLRERFVGITNMLLDKYAVG